MTKKNKEDEEEIRLYLGKFKEHFRRQIALQASLVILNHLLHEHKTEPSVSDLEKLISPLIKDRSETLGFRNEEYYNFVVYILDKTDKELKVFYRSCDDRIQRTDRSWSIGVGHVGIAFANNQTIIKSDSAGNPEYKSKHSKETDDKYYASFISSPIFNGYNTEKDEIGIFEITSSRPGHFEDDDKIIVDSYSFLLSLYFSGCGRNGVTHE